MGRFANMLTRMNPINGYIIDSRGNRVNRGDFIKRMNSIMDPFGALRVTNYEPVFSSRPIAVSKIYDRVFTTGESDITVVEGEYKLTNPGGETCRLETAQRGRYQSGIVGVPGVGARRTTAPSGTTTYYIGYFDGDNGFGFKEDVNGLATFVRRAGEEIYSNPRSEWLDPLDGTGPSGKTINLLDGKIIRLPFLWYGYGSLTMAIVAPSDNLEADDEVIAVDRFRPTEQVSIVNANLPITVEITGDSPGEMYVGGRQYGVFGTLDLRRKLTGEKRDGASVGDTLVPLISARVRPTDPWVTVPIQMEGFGNITDGPLDLVIILGADLTNGGDALTDDDWAISQYSEGDTSVEFNTTADAYTGGELLGGPYFVTTTGSGGNATGSAEVSIPSQDIPIGEPVSIMARSRDGTTVTTDNALRMAELR